MGKITLLGNVAEAGKWIAHGKAKLRELKSFLVPLGITRKMVRTPSAEITVSSILGIDRIVIDGRPEVGGPEVLFLIYKIENKHKYAAWKIKDNGQELIPITIDLQEPTLELFPDFSKYPPPEEFNVYVSCISTVKSNKGFNNHRFTVQDLENPSDIDYESQYYRYGLMRFTFLGHYDLRGLRNSYEPDTFDDSIDYWFYRQYDFSLPLEFNPYPWYICSSRHPYMYYKKTGEDGGFIRNLELWLIDDNTYQIKYMNSKGEEKQGIIVPNSFKFAVLSPEFFFGHAPLEAGSAPANVHIDTEIDLGCEQGIVTPTIHEELYGSGVWYDFLFGSVVLGHYGIGSQEINEYEWMTYNVPCYASTNTHNCENGNPPYWVSWPTVVYHYCSGGIQGNLYTKIFEQTTKKNTGSILQIMDYDNCVPKITSVENSNIDDTFIVICYEKIPNFYRDTTTYSPVWVVTEIWEEAVWCLDNDDYPPVWVQIASYPNIAGSWQEWPRRFEETKTDSKFYYIKYRLKGGELITIPICEYAGSNTTQVSYVPGYDKIPCPWGGGVLDVWWPQSTVYEDIVYIENGGTQVFFPTTIATDKYLFYSYVLRSTEDGGLNWTFVKRVIGIIEINTGDRHEHEITDEDRDLLGEIYNKYEIFDERVASAIGLHRGVTATVN